jgi:hypothetical protein
MAYRGVVARLPVGAQGFTGTANPSQAGPGHLLYVDGAELDQGIIRKEGGASKLNSSAIGGGVTIISGINWSPAASTYYDAVFTSDGEIRRDTGGGTFTHAYITGLNAPRDPPPWFLVAGGESVGSARRLMCFSATNQVKTVSGTADTMANIGSPPADWSSSFPTFGILHANRVFAGGNASDPHRIYYSTVGDHTDFVGSGAGSLSVFPGEGEGIVGALSFRGALIVFKYPKGIYIVQTVDPSPINWGVSPVSRQVGTLNQHTIVPIENDVLYMDRFGGLHQLSATNEFGDINTSNLGLVQDINPFMRDNINLALMKRAQAIWYANKRQAWIALPRNGSTDNDFRLIIGFNSFDQEGNQVPRFFMSRRDIPVSMWLRPTSNGVEKPVHGDNEGFIWTMDEDSRNKEDQPYTIRMETSNTDLGFLDQSLATKMKSGQFLELAFEPKGDWFLDVEVYWDDVLTEVLQYQMGSPSGAALDAFVLDSDVLTSLSVKSIRKKISGSGRRIKLVIENTGVNQDIAISEFHLSFVPGDERTPE